MLHRCHAVMTGQTRFDSATYFAFQEAFLAAIVARFTKAEGTKKRTTSGRSPTRLARTTSVHPVSANAESSEDLAAELSDFAEYLAEETFSMLPDELQTMSFVTMQNNPMLRDKYELPLDSTTIPTLADALSPSTCDALQSHGLIASDGRDLDRFVDDVFTQFIANATAAPHEFTPEATSSRPDGCEICMREQLPLTYHHLIPRAVHSKAIKRGWHREWELNKVAWLCRACHSFIHKIESNEILARDFHTVDLLMARDDVRRWAAWASKVRWRCK